MKCKFRLIIFYWVPPVLYAALIAFLSSRPGLSIGPKIIHIDKLYHALIYLVLALLLWRAFYYASPPSVSRRAILFALLLTILFGISDELHQYFVPFRNADVCDLIFDTIGASLAIIGVIRYNDKKKKQR